MIMAPLRALTGTPSTSMLTSSSLIPSCRAAARLDDAVAVLDVVLELVPEMSDEALHGPRRRVAERADSVSLDVVGDAHQHIHVFLAALARQDPRERAVEPAGALAARRALAAGLHVIEAREALEHAHHVGGLVHDDNRRGADRRTRLPERVVVHVRGEHRLARHHRHG